MTFMRKCEFSCHKQLPKKSQQYGNLHSSFVFKSWITKAANLSPEYSTVGSHFPLNYLSQKAYQSRILQAVFPIPNEIVCNVNTSTLNDDMQFIIHFSLNICK